MAWGSELWREVGSKVRDKAGVRELGSEAQWLCIRKQPRECQTSTSHQNSRTRWAGQRVCGAAGVGHSGGSRRGSELDCVYMQTVMEVHADDSKEVGVRERIL